MCFFDNLLPLPKKEELEMSIDSQLFKCVIDISIDNVESNYSLYLFYILFYFTPII